ncbi:MAG: hypothetical protein AAF621_00535 [Pseudomonadota bacterium]
MSAIDVLNSVLNEIGITKSAPELSTTSDLDVIEIRNFMNLAGQEIARRADFAELYVDVGTGGNISSYDLPQSFSRLPSMGGTVKLNKQGVFTPVIPVVEDASWQLVAARASSHLYHYHLLNKKILFSPVLDSDGALVRYISKYWVNDPASGADVIGDNGDILLVPENLVQKGTVWRWRRRKGMSFEDHLAEFEADIETELASNRGGL